MTGSTDVYVPRTNGMETQRQEAPLEAAAIARLAKDQVAQLRGLTPEGVSGVTRNADGWHVSVDVVELKRIPTASDVLATYDVTLDDHGHLLQCERVHRYFRGQVAG